jgi:hypothetical protein
MIHPAQIAQVELEVLKLLQFDVGRVRPVQILEHASEILISLQGLLSMPEGKENMVSWFGNLSTTKPFCFQLHQMHKLTSINNLQCFLQTNSIFYAQMVNEVFGLVYSVKAATNDTTWAVLHLSFSNLIHSSLVLDNVSIQLGASSCIATAYALHEKGSTQGTFLYVLASHSTESSWDVGDLQVIIAHFLQLIEDSPKH